MLVQSSPEAAQQGQQSMAGNGCSVCGSCQKKPADCLWLERKPWEALHEQEV